MTHDPGDCMGGGGGLMEEGGQCEGSEGIMMAASSSESPHLLLKRLEEAELRIQEVLEDNQVLKTRSDDLQRDLEVALKEADSLREKADQADQLERDLKDWQVKHDKLLKQRDDERNRAVLAEREVRREKAEALRMKKDLECKRNEVANLRRHLKQQDNDGSASYTNSPLNTHINTHTPSGSDTHTPRTGPVPACGCDTRTHSTHTLPDASAFDSNNSDTTISTTSSGATSSSASSPSSTPETHPQCPTDTHTRDDRHTNARGETHTTGQRALEEHTTAHTHTAATAHANTDVGVSASPPLPRPPAMLKAHSSPADAAAYVTITTPRSGASPSLNEMRTHSRVHMLTQTYTQPHPHQPVPPPMPLPPAALGAQTQALPLTVSVGAPSVTQAQTYAHTHHAAIAAAMCASSMPSQTYIHASAARGMQIQVPQTGAVLVPQPSPVHARAYQQGVFQAVPHSKQALLQQLPVGLAPSATVAQLGLPLQQSIKLAMQHTVAMPLVDPRTQLPTHTRAHAHHTQPTSTHAHTQGCYDRYPTAAARVRSPSADMYTAVQISQQQHMEALLLAQQTRSAHPYTPRGYSREAVAEAPTHTHPSSSLSPPPTEPLLLSRVPSSTSTHTHTHTLPPQSLSSLQPHTSTYIPTPPSSSSFVDAHANTHAHAAAAADTRYYNPLGYHPLAGLRPPTPNRPHTHAHTSDAAGLLW